ncbi:MAG: EamA family transporter [Pseudomonadota bacterium]
MSAPTPMQKPHLWWLTVPLLTLINQTCMKLLSEGMGDVPFGLDWLTTALSTPYMAGIVLSEILSFILWIRILSTIDVSRAAPLTAVAYVLILLTGWFAFDEPVLPLQLIGSALILVGVTLIGTATKPAE